MNGKYEHLISRRHGRSANGAYFHYGSLIKINGVYIDAIWCPDDLSTDPLMIGTTHWKYDAYFSHGEDDKKANKIGALPEEFKPLFGWQVIQGRKVFVRHISFRTSSSGHASTDNIMTIYCNDTSLSVWHSPDVEWETVVEKGITIKRTSALTEQNEYVQKWLSLFKKNFVIKYPAKNTNGQWKPTFTNLHWSKGTFFEKLGGLNYPCTESKPWQPFGHNPFVVNPVDQNCLRFFDESMKAHVFVKRIPKPTEEHLDLIHVTISRDNPYFLHVARWSKSGDMVRYAVKQVHKNDMITTICSQNNGDDKLYKDKQFAHGFYEVQRIQRVK